MSRPKGFKHSEETRRRIKESNTAHGMHGSPEYRAYNSAKNRCTNPNNKQWEDYGGRGIKFLFSSFEQFFTELGTKPEPKRKYVLDREDNDGNYEPGNVRWLTTAASALNQRPGEHHVLTMEVARLLRQQFATSEYRLRDLARIHGISNKTIQHVLKGHAWKEKDRQEKTYDNYT
jgi:hypothetical protein